ncbi:MAG TPA: hypothetical protein VF746_13430 [Longimicrobium sp.]|jgi:hypothetical protein
MPSGFGLMKVKPYAMRREELGLVGFTPKAVRDALKRFDVGRDSDGCFDADLLHRLWQEEIAERGADVSRSRRPEQGGVEGGEWGEREGAPAANAEPLDTSPGELPADWREIKAKDKGRFQALKEWFLAGKHRLDFEERLGQLVALDFHVEKLEALAYAVREVLNQVPGKYAPRMAGVQQDFRASIEDLRNRLADDPSRMGVLEQVVALDSDATTRAQAILDDAIDEVLSALANVAESAESDAEHDAP